ncbi:MAG: caspase family protein, partial [Pirellulales bacterium]
MRTTSPFLLMALLLLGCVAHEEASTDVKHPQPEAETSLPVEQAGAAIEHSVAYGSISTAAIETAAAEPRSVDGRRYGLLIGCTKYYNLPDADLSGPSNDVRLMRSLLVDQFGFSKDDIAVLIEEQPKKNRPTKKNIVREFKALAAKAKPGDQVVILLSGHGTQQPDDDPDNKDDLEPDGMDEVFCPADTEVSPFFAAAKVPNGITDDEMRGLLADIRQAGASLWIIIDSCHSGTSVRGNRVYRQIRPETLMPKMAAPPVPRSATRSVAKTDGFGLDQQQQGGLVAIYASHAYEPTFELALPAGSDDAEPHGILTYTLAHVLMATDENMTYTELVKRIQDEYIMHGVAAPTPLVEGSDRHLEVLGQKSWPDRSRLTLQVHLETGLPKVDAGRLHGINKGCIFALYPPAGEANPDKPIAYVEVTRANKSFSMLEPCAYGDLEKADKLVLGGRLEIVHYDYGDMRLAVAVDAETEIDGFDTEAWQQKLATIAGREGSVIRAADSV